MKPSPATPPVTGRLTLAPAPGTHSSHRMGVVDVGSNSIRLVIFDDEARSPAYFFNEKVLCGLGQGLAETGLLNPQGRLRAIAALKRFAAVARGMRVSSLRAVATAAVREACDGRAFCEEVLAATGLDLDIIDGDEEARLSAQGVLLGWPEASGMVCDLGGSSLEMARIGDGSVGARVSCPLGPFELQRLSGGARERIREIDRVLALAQERVASRGERLFLVGGSFRVIARLDMERRGYPLLVLHEYRMTPGGLLETLDWIARADPEALCSRIGTSPQRMELLPIAAEVLRALISHLAPSEIDVSAYGLREGVLFDRMPVDVRQLDPLIEAARLAELTQARMPGFGVRLNEFLAPLFRKEGPGRLRLVKAACLLHDTTWRAHPDYRAEACFDHVTRANLGGLDHPGRVFLGLALLHRYKNRRAGGRLEPMLTLLSHDELRDAEVLGKAMRFGAMFAAANPARAGRLSWKRKKRILGLDLSPEGAILFGEVVRARFLSLAQALKAEPAIRLSPAERDGTGNEETEGEEMERPAC